MKQINLNVPRYQIGIIYNALDLMDETDRHEYLKRQNWSIVRDILTGHTSRGGSTSAIAHCRYLAIDPDGHYFAENYPQPTTPKKAVNETN